MANNPRTGPSRGDKHGEWTVTKVDADGVHLAKKDGSTMVKTAEEVAAMPKDTTGSGERHAGSWF